MKSATEPRNIYKIVAVVMTVIGSSLLVLSLSNFLNPRARCQDSLDVGGYYGGYPAQCSATAAPIFETMLPGSNNFILIILSSCIIAFGGAIVGMIIRLEK